MQVTIGYGEFCDLLKRLEPEWQAGHTCYDSASYGAAYHDHTTMTSLWQEDQLDLSLTLTLTLTMSLTLTLTWQEDQLDDALMALVGEIGQATDQEVVALPAKSTASRHLSLDHTHANPGVVPGTAPVAAPAAAPAAAAATAVAAAVAGTAAGGVLDGSSMLAAGRKLASDMASKVLGGAAEDAAGAWVEGGEAFLLDKHIYMLLERETKELLPMAHLATLTPNLTPTLPPTLTPNPHPNPTPNPTPNPHPHPNPKPEPNQAHLTIVRATLSNLRNAGFDVAEGNLLLRALYSWNDALNGGAMRLEAWRLLARRRDHLRHAADKLADEAGDAPRNDTPHAPPMHPPCISHASLMHLS